MKESQSQMIQDVASLKDDFNNKMENLDSNLENSSN